MKKYLPLSILKFEPKAPKRSDLSVTKGLADLASIKPDLASTDSMASPISIETSQVSEEDLRAKKDSDLEHSNVTLAKNDSKDSFILYSDASDLANRKLDLISTINGNQIGILIVLLLSVKDSMCISNNDNENKMILIDFYNKFVAKIFFNLFCSRSSRFV